MNGYTYEAVNRYGNVVRTFSDHELALNFQAAMSHQGSEFVIRRARRIISYAGVDQYGQQAA